MSKAKSGPAKPVFVAPSQVVWTDERLAALDKTQLMNLLSNLQTQKSLGRISEETATELEVKIRARVPASVATPRRKRPRSEVMLDLRAADQLGTLALQLARRYDLGAAAATAASAGVRGFRPHPLVDSKGHARTGAAVKSGLALIERYIAYRQRDTLVGLAFIVLAEPQEERGQYVLIGTDDAVNATAESNPFTAVATLHGWSAASRQRMRAEPVARFEEGAERLEALIAGLTSRLQ